MSSARSKTVDDGRRAPDLEHFRARYPLLVKNLATLPEREASLRRIWELEARWQESAQTSFQAKAEDGKSSAVVYGAPPANLNVEAEFAIIYAGGVLGLLHAAVMSSRYGHTVLVFDQHTVGRTHRDWNISDAELVEFTRAGLFTKDELERAVMNRYTGGFVKFHDQTSRVKAAPLWMNGVLDVAVDADKLLQLAAEKIKTQDATHSRLVSNVRFVRCYIQPERVTVETEDVRTGARRLFAARLFVDATGTNSPVSREINDNVSITHVCPTVGTVARGFARNQLNESAPEKVDFSVGEILVSNEDASAGRQLIWEGFAGSPTRDEYTTYLFFYDRVNSQADKSLLNLFERYFETLPKYKRAGAQWRVTKPVFGYIPSYHHQGFGGNRKRTACDRVLLVGDAAGLSSPLTFCGFGSHVRNLHRLTTMTNERLVENCLDENSLREINAYEPRVAQMASLAEFMRPTNETAPAAINETMNAVMSALHKLDESVRRELFQDRMSFQAFKKLLTTTAKLYPRIFGRVREHLGARGTFWWIANVAETLLHERRHKSAANEKTATLSASEEIETSSASVISESSAG